MVKKGLPSFLSNESLKLVIFGGKGGTGKTTCAAATATYVARTFPEKKIGIISTDPAHSLGDSFNCPLSWERTPIKGFSKLWALELDPEKMRKDFSKKHAREMEVLVQRSGFYGQTSLDKFLTFSLPGMDEAMIFLQIAQIFKPLWYKPAETDLIILDTAPTGHTLRLLSLPQRVDEWIDVFDTSLKRYRTSPRVPFATVRTSTPRPGGDFVDDFVKDMRRNIEFVGSLLQDSQRCEFVPVAIPEPMGILETQDLLSGLKRLEIPVKNIVVNRVQSGEGCEFCSPRRKEQEKVVAETRRKFAPYNLIEMPLFPYEIQGEKRLLTYGKTLSGKSSYRQASKSEVIASRSSERRKEAAKQSQGEDAANNLQDLLKDGLKFILFGGKGGVGKTSLAAATALHMANLFPNRKVLIYSLDPAHSLADSFRFPIGDKVTPVPGVSNLFALETDAAKLHHEFMDGIRELIENAFLLWTKHLNYKGESRWDRQVMNSFAQASPPGLDEVLALEQIMEFAKGGEYDLYILDTAPTGHLLTLLEFPELIRDWMRFAYSRLLKWNVEVPLTEVTDLGNIILKSTTNLRKIRQNLTDAQRSELIAITIPEAMGIAETRDLLDSLDRLGIPCRHVVINQIIPPTRCSFCSSKRKEELKYVEELRDTTSSDRLIAEIPLLPHEISGIEDLTQLSQIMYGNSSFKKEVNNERMVARS